MQKQIFKRRLRLILAAVYLVAAFWWVSSTSSASDGIMVVGIALLLGAALGFVVLSFRLKRAFLRLFAPGSLRIASIESFPHLDKTELERLTQSWQKLGFEPGVDRGGNMDNPKYGQTFSRVLEHPVQGAVAEISQLFSPTKAGPITLSVVSFWGARAPIFQMAGQIERAAANAINTPPLSAPVAPLEDEPPELPDEIEMWLLTTHNRAPNKFWQLMRRKRLLSRRLTGDVTPETLWRAHLEQRAKVAVRLNSPHETGALEALLEAHGQVLSAQLHAHLKRTPAWKFGLARFSPAASPAVYDGELPA